MQHNHGAISFVRAIKCFDLTKPGRRTKDKIDGPRSFPWFVLRSHASSSLSLDRTRRTAFNDCFGLDKKEGTPLHRKRSSNLFSLSLFLMMPPPPPLAIHRVWPRLSSKRLYRAQPRSQDKDNYVVTRLGNKSQLPTSNCPNLV